MCFPAYFVKLHFWYENPSEVIIVSFRANVTHQDFITYLRYLLCNTLWQLTNMPCFLRCFCLKYSTSKLFYPNAGALEMDRKSYICIISSFSTKNHVGYNYNRKLLKRTKLLFIIAFCSLFGKIGCSLCVLNLNSYETHIVEFLLVQMMFSPSFVLL